MAWTPQSFDEACKRAAGRRAYNRKRRLARERRIKAILRLQDAEPPSRSGRELARLLNVHEATISRDLKFIRKVRDEYRRTNGAEMHAHSFRFARGGGGYETVFEIRWGVRVR